MNDLTPGIKTQSRSFFLQDSVSDMRKFSSEVAWPKISIVTPSFNQARFLEETIRSILKQGYPNLEYIIVDGGSTDGSVDIIKKYKQRLAHWVSEPDEGMYHAINKGFSISTGEIMGWSNADDVYQPGAFKTLAEIFINFGCVEWLTSLHKVSWNERNEEIGRYRVKGFNKKSFFRGYHLPGDTRNSGYVIQQQSTFWRRSLWERAGGWVDQRLQLAGDFELWIRFFQLAELYAVDSPVGVFRHHSQQKTKKQMELYLEEAQNAFISHGGQYPGSLEIWIRDHILKRIPRNVLRYIPWCTYRSKQILWNESDRTWIIRSNLFV